jgi:hypothetical protein
MSRFSNAANAANVANASANAANANSTSIRKKTLRSQNIAGCLLKLASEGKVTLEFSDNKEGFPTGSYFIRSIKSDCWDVVVNELNLACGYTNVRSGTLHDCIAQGFRYNAVVPLKKDTCHNASWARPYHNEWCFCTITAAKQARILQNQYNKFRLNRSNAAATGLSNPEDFLVDSFFA